MYGITVYTDVADLINKMPYPVILPEIALKMSDAHLNGELEPFFEPDRNAMVHSRITIDEMINLTSKNLGFEFRVTEDAFEVYKYLSVYTDDLKRYEALESAQDYLAKSLAFLDRLSKVVWRLRRKHPDLFATINKPTFEQALNRALALG